MAQESLGDARVLYEDNHLLVVDKPAGLLTQAATAGDDNLLDRCKTYIKLKHGKPGNVYLGLVHRLDRNVSGVLVLARTSKAAARLTKAFKQRSLDKTYLAVVVGEITRPGSLRHLLGPNPLGRGVIETRSGKDARLSFQCLASRPTCSLLEINLETGRKHQIRAQLAISGNALVGDPLYGKPTAQFRRPALLACSLAFDHPVGGAPLSFKARIPLDLKHLLTKNEMLDAALAAIGQAIPQ